MWGWIRGHKTFTTGIVVLVVALSVSAYAVTAPADGARRGDAVLQPSDPLPVRVLAVPDPERDARRKRMGLPPWEPLAGETTAETLERLNRDESRKRLGLPPLGGEPVAQTTPEPKGLVGRTLEVLGRPGQLGAEAMWRLVLWGGVAGILVGGAVVLASALPLHRTAEWMRRKLLTNLLSARGALLLGVVILTMSVFGFMQSSSELEEIRASYGRFFILLQSGICNNSFAVCR